MKYFFVPLFLFAGCGALQGQILGRFYYNEYWELTKQDSAVYFRVGVFDTTRCVFAGTVQDFTKAGTLLMKGVYKHGVKEGPFVFYFPNGQMESIGEYFRNIRTGVWKYFYKNGVPKQEVEFSESGHRMIFYNDSTGRKLLENGNGDWMEEYEVLQSHQLIKISNEGHYYTGRINGEWISKLNGEFKYKEKYVDGQFKSGYLTDPSGKKKKEYHRPMGNKLPPPYRLRVIEALTRAKGISRSDYPFIRQFSNEQDLGDDDSIHTFADQQPEFRGGIPKMLAFLKSEIHYPPLSRQYGIDGKVFVSFVVEKDGAVTNVEVVRGVNDDLNAEAVRVVKLFPKWTPALQNSKPVRVKFILPINFILPVRR